MYSNPFVSQLVAKERVNDTLRQAEKARLIRVAEGSVRPGRWFPQMILALKNWWPRFDGKRAPVAKVRSLPR
jgi:hypothetical protein